MERVAVTSGRWTKWRCSRCGHVREVNPVHDPGPRRMRWKITCFQGSYGKTFTGCYAIGDQWHDRILELDRGD